VVIGPTGVFCIETKTWSKPLKGDHRIKYDGGKILVNGKEITRDPIAQVKAGSQWLYNIIEASTGKKFSIQPVVLFPGWYVEPMPPHAEVWVLNEKAVVTFIQNARTHIASEDVSLITFHLKRYVISKESQKE